jgi:type I restriction enzyme S subunit
MNFFEDPQHAGISAVIYSKDVVLNHPEKLGEDCILVHNPLAKNPLPEKIITFLKQYKVQGDDIINF